MSYFGDAFVVLKQRGQFYVLAGTMLYKQTSLLSYHVHLYLFPHLFTLSICVFQAFLSPAKGTSVSFRIVSSLPGWLCDATIVIPIAMQ